MRELALYKNCIIILLLVRSLEERGTDVPCLWDGGDEHVSCVSVPGWVTTVTFSSTCYPAAGLQQMAPLKDIKRCCHKLLTMSCILQYCTRVI